jgi:hypothetical protein
MGEQTVLACPLCGQAELRHFLDVERVPVHVGVLWPTAEEARASATGDLSLAACSACGLVTNTAFDESLIDYRQKYDNALHASPLFQEFESSLVEHLAARYDLRGRTAVEIGCGSGHFIGLLCTRAGAAGRGYDPSHDPAFADPLAQGKVEFVADQYGPQHAEHPVDLLVCRQTLEHVADARGFLLDLRKRLDSHEGVVTYFDVPNSTMPFESLSIWDLIYEHVHYFVAPTLRYAFTSTGFDVLDLRETFEGQFLSLEARPGDGATGLPGAAELEGPLASVEAFGRRFGERRERWHERLAGYASSGTRAVVWGGGARAVSFFSMLGIGEQIPYVVDINPRKQGHHLGGGGQRIVAPEFLTGYAPDIVIVLNPLYVREITETLRGLGSGAEVVTA